MAKALNLIGQKFDRLTVLEKTDKRSCGSIVWKCQCDCGNICERSSNVLKRKQQHHSCGCFNHEQISTLSKKDLTNMRFGKLIALEPTEKRSGTCIVWKCQCDCGNIVEVRSGSLTTGNTSSCGCINYSIGEKNIEKILKENNISYISQYTNSELKLKKYDFALLTKNTITRLIEFDGEQHYNDLKGLWNSSESLEEIQQRDKEKNQWAKENNIPLVRIPYWERDNITLEMILGDRYLVNIK